MVTLMGLEVSASDAHLNKFCGSRQMPYLGLEGSCSQEAAVKVPCVKVERSRQVYQGPKVKEYYLSSTSAPSKPPCTEPVTVTKLLKNMSSQSK